MTGTGARACLQIGSGIALCAVLFLAALQPRWGLAQMDRPVEMELVLAVDSSVSIDPAEFALQMDGLAQAFRDPAVIAAIEGSGDGGIAVTLVQWGVGLEQEIAVDWAQVTDPASAESFARAIESSPRHIVGNGTAITRALWFSAGLFEDNGFRGLRRVIDVSGDGRNNSGGHPATMRDRLVAAGIVVNGLAILDGDPLLGLYYESHVAGGSGSFVVTADSFRDFAEAIKEKLLREISAPVAAATGRQTPLI